MLSLSQFGLLLRIYGAEPERWPEPMRDDAGALLASSEEARRLHGEAQHLDRQIDAALALERPSHSEQRAAVARLRAHTASRLVAREARQPRRKLAAGLADWVIEATSPNLRVVGLIGGICLAIVAGLVVGATSSLTPTPGTASLVTMLQPSPLQIFDEGGAP